MKITKYHRQSLRLLTLLLIALAAIAAPSHAAAACPTPGTIYGSDTVVINVPSTATYRFWVRMDPPNSSSNSFMLQIDSGTCFAAGGSAAIPSGTWTWVDYQNGSGSQIMQAALNAGNHSLELIGTQQNVEVDSVLLSADPNCVPIGTGSNCTTAQPATVTTSTTSGGGSATTGAGGPTARTTAKANPLSSQNIISSGIPLNSTNTPVSVTKSLVISPTYVKGQTIKQVEYFLNSKKVYTATKAPFTYTLNPNKLTSGKYILASKTIYTSGLSVTAHETIAVKHPLFKDVSILLINNFWELLLAGIVLGAVIIAMVKNEVFIRAAIKKAISKIRSHQAGSSNPPPPPVIYRPDDQIQ